MSLLCKSDGGFHVDGVCVGGRNQYYRRFPRLLSATGDRSRCPRLTVATLGLEWSLTSCHKRVRIFVGHLWCVVVGRAVVAEPPPRGRPFGFARVGRPTRRAPRLAYAHVSWMLGVVCVD